ncbi:protein kinase [Actinoplanes sp. NPDC048967]|uniref:protein kinase domain-containing protein n=1 Tax=Actinoplanes sp. NPDC048967 TaxID=3155269 RepID=UPI00340AAEE5
MSLLAGRYRLDRPVGRGGMATVWRAHDQVLRRTVAVKVLAAGLSEDPPEDAVRQEAMIAARLCHPHIAAVHDYGETLSDGRRQPFLVMEFVDGPTLAARITEAGPLPWREAATVCAQVADALAAAHENALVHRDIKPSNVMLSRAGAKVVDFGVAAGAGDGVTDRAGRIWGTPGYLPPEQLGPGPVLPAGDVFALGVLLFECLTGHPPWRPANSGGVLAERARDPLPELPDQDEVPDDLVQLYRRCLASSPDDRPGAREVATMLQELVRPAPALRPRQRPARPPARPTPATRADVRMTRPRRVAGLSAALLAALCAALAVQLTGVGNQQPAAQAQPVEDGLATATACKAEYASVRLPDGSFTARLAVTNIGGGDLRDWSVRFRLPQRQRVAEVTGARWSQQSRIVTLTAADRLASGAKAAMTVRGTFDEQQDGVPGAFSVGGVPCTQAVTRVQTSSTPGPTDTATAENHSGGRGAADETVKTDDPGRSSSSSTTASHTVTDAPIPAPHPSSGQSSRPVESSAPEDPSGSPSWPPDGGAPGSPAAPEPSSSDDTPASPHPTGSGDKAEQPEPDATPPSTGLKPRAR